jgi:hypothetical protein
MKVRCFIPEENRAPLDRRLGEPQVAVGVVVKRKILL